MDVTRESLVAEITKRYPEMQENNIVVGKKITNKARLLLRHIQSSEGIFGKGERYGSNCVEITVACKDMENPFEANKFEQWLQDNCDLYFIMAYRNHCFEIQGQALFLPDEVKAVCRSRDWSRRNNYPEIDNTVNFYIFGKIADLVSTGVMSKSDLLGKIETEMKELYND